MKVSQCQASRCMHQQVHQAKLFTASLGQTVNRVEIRLHPVDTRNQCGDHSPSGNDSRLNARGR